MRKAIPMRRHLKPFALSLFLAAFLLNGCGGGILFNLDLDSYAPSVNLDRDFPWYKSQMNTGRYSGNNCGPASVSMAIKYFQNRDVAVEDVRNNNNVGWWSMDDVENSLNAYHVGHETIPLMFKEQLFTSLSEGHLVIMCLNMSIVTREPRNAETKYNRFYDNVTGHFLILKGYSEDKQWFLAYDSNTWANDYYPDRTPKGKDRLYNVREVFDSAKVWNPNFIEM